jgi:hypothetical protein
VIGNDKYHYLPSLVADHLGKLGFEVITVENGNRRTMNAKLTELTGKLAAATPRFSSSPGMASPSKTATIRCQPTRRTSTKTRKRW